MTECCASFSVFAEWSVSVFAAEEESLYDLLGLGDVAIDKEEYMKNRLTDEEREQFEREGVSHQPTLSVRVSSRKLSHMMNRSIVIMTILTTSRSIEP